MPTKQTCNEDSCRAVRNILADAYEMLAKALEEIAELEDNYGDPYTKKTCLWTGGTFVMPEKKRVEATLGSMMHTLPATKDRARIRSTTPMGFANAVFAANAL